MKKIVKLLTLSLIPLLICSCNRTNNSLENSEPTLSSNEVLSDNSEESKQTSSSNKYQIELGKKYTSTSWDNTINEMLEFVLEDKASKVPSFIAPSYDAVIHNKIIDEHHRELVCTINCYGVNSSSAGGQFPCRGALRERPPARDRRSDRRSGGSDSELLQRKSDRSGRFPSDGQYQRNGDGIACHESGNLQRDLR